MVHGHALRADRWGPLRHGELVELSGGISRKVLTQTLRRLQANGLVERHAYAEAPPRVEYGLTDLGRTLEEPIRMLTAWARENGEAVVNFREAAEAARNIETDQANPVKTLPRDQNLNRF